jgi:hypothetical protein
MTLTKNVLTRIIKEELAKIVSEQRNPRQINEIADPVLTPAVIEMIIKSLGSTAVITKAMAIVNAGIGAAMGGAAAASKHMTDKQTFDGGDDEPMQEAKKKATSTCNAAKMGFGTKSKMASHKFSPLKTKK